MIHPHILKILAVVLLMYASMLMLIQPGLIAPRPTVEKPPKIQAYVIPATPEPIKQPESLKQQPVKQKTSKSVSIVRLVAQPEPMPMPIPAPILLPLGDAPVTPAASPASPAPAPERAPVPVPVSSGPIGVGINDIQCSELPLVYPSMSRKIGEEGRAIVKISIGMTGEVTSVAVTSSSDSPRLDRAVADAAHATRCSPCKQNGRAVPVVASKPLVFKFDS